MLKTTNRPVIISALVIAIALSSLFASSLSGPAIVANTTNCPSSVYLTKPFEGESVSGQTLLEAYVPNTMNAYEVIFLLNNNIIGSGSKVDQNWRLPFNSSTYPNGSYILTAQVRFGPTTPSSCTTFGRGMIISNSPEATSFHIEAIPNMVSWSGPTNVTIRFIVRVYGVSGTNRTDVTSTSAYNWQTNIGSLSPSSNESNFFSGPMTGSGEIKLVVTYSGKTQTVTFPIQIKSPNNTTAYPNESPTNSTQAQPPAEQNNSTGQLTPAGIQYQGDAELKTCLNDKLDGFEKPEDQKESRLKFSEIDKAEGCFAQRKFIIPSNLAPIAPDKVKDIKEEKDRIKIEKIFSPSSSNQQAIILSGIAKPNKTVIIYIFSEPLVLAAKTDDTGRWSYTLEDPLEPGSHEAYVTVEGDNPDEAIRSPGFTFGVASTVKTKENPFGLSLLIQNKRDPRTVYIMYIMGIGSILSAATATVLFINMKHKAKMLKNTAPENNSVAE